MCGIASQYKSFSFPNRDYSSLPQCPAQRASEWPCHLYHFSSLNLAVNLMSRVVTYAYFFLQRSGLLLTLDTINILCTVYLNFCSSKIILKDLNDYLGSLNSYYFFSFRNLSTQ